MDIEEMYMQNDYTSFYHEYFFIYVNDMEQQLNANCNCLLLTQHINGEVYP